MNRFDIGRRIELYRDKLKMSTQELAGRIHRSQATISRIENGKQGLTFELLSRIATELRVHPFALLSDEPLRSSVLLPASGRKDGEYAPSLLANALRGGRLRRGLGLEDAAKSLGVSVGELESIELALSSPDDNLLDRIAELYGLSARELGVVRKFTEDAPATARGLAYLQQLFSPVYHMAKDAAEGSEREVLNKITELIESADSDYPLPPDAHSDDVGLLLNSLSMYLASALKNREFRGRVFQMAGIREGEERQGQG